MMLLLSHFFCEVNSNTILINSLFASVPGLDLAASSFTLVLPADSNELPVNQPIPFKVSANVTVRNGASMPASEFPRFSVAIFVSEDKEWNAGDMKVDYPMTECQRQELIREVDGIDVLDLSDQG